MWAAIDTAVEGNRKVRLLASMMGWNPDQVLARWVRYLLAVRQDAPDGTVTGWTDKHTAAVMGCQMADGPSILTALHDCGLLYSDGEEVKVAGWMERNGRFTKDAKRKSRLRESAESGMPSAESGGLSAEVRGSRARPEQEQEQDSLPSVENLEPARPQAASVRSSEPDRTEPPAPARAPEPVAVAEPNPFTPPPSRQQTVEDAIHAECIRLKTGPNVERTAMSLAGKIRKHSPWVNPVDVVGIVRFWLERRSTIENVFAYFAKDSEGFVFAERAVRLEREQAEHEANKRAPVGPIISRLAEHFAMPTNGTKP